MNKYKYKTTNKGNQEIWVSFNFREKYLNVYTGCDDKVDAVDRITKTLGSHIEVTEWRDGVTFNLSKNEDFQKLRAWLKV